MFNIYFPSIFHHVFITKIKFAQRDFGTLPKMYDFFAKFL